MRCVLLMCIVVILMGCGDTDVVEPSEDRATLARWQGGTLSTAQFDRYLARIGGLADTKDRDDLVRDASIFEILSDPEQLALVSGTEALRAELAEQSVIANYWLMEAEAFELPSSVDLELAYLENIDYFVAEELRSFRHLFIQADEERSAQHAFALAQKLRTDVFAGASFEAIARKHSDSEMAINGGLHPPTNKSNLAPDLAELIFDLPGATLSEVITTSAGAHFFQIEEIIPARDIAFDEAIPVLQQQVVRQATLLAQRRWLEQADVTVLEDENGDQTPSFTTEQATALYQAYAFRTPANVALSMEAFVETKINNRLIAAKHADRPVPAVISRAAVEAKQAILVEARLSQALLDFVLTDEDILMNYFAINEQRFYTPMQFQLGWLEKPLDGDTAQRDSNRGAAIVAELNAGDLTPTAAAERWGASWRISEQAVPYAMLRALDPGAAAIVVDLQSNTFAGPYTRDGSIVILHALEREDPAPQPFQTVKKAVAEQFIASQPAQIYAAWRQAELNARSFELVSR